MSLPTPHEALIYLMVITSASDRDMTDVELARIGDVVRSWPVFEDFNHDRLVGVAQDCQKSLHEKDGLEGVLSRVAEALPERLRDTAYAAAFEVAAVDLEMRHGGSAGAAAHPPPARSRHADRRGHWARRQGPASHADLEQFQESV